MGLLASRISSLLLLLLGTFGFGLLPIAIKRKMKTCACKGVHDPACPTRRYNRIISFLIYFGGGVLLATCIVHLMPEAREGFESHKEKMSKDVANDSASNNNVTGDDGDHEGHDHEEFPIPEFVVCCGFFAVYLVEEVIHALVGGHSHDDDKEVGGGGGGHGHSHLPTQRRSSTPRARTPSLAASCCDETTPEYPQSTVVLINCIRRDSVLSPEDFPPLPEDEPPKSRSFSLSSRITIGPEDAKAQFTVSGLFTVVALSFHSLFEGFAVGLQQTELGTWTLFFAIAVHKFVIAFVVGLEVLMEGGRELVLVVYMVVFSLMSPLGSLAAILTDVSLSESSELIVGVLNALATGTLLYVTFFEILQRSKKDELSGLLQLLSTFVGFGLMAIVQFASTFA